MNSESLFLVSKILEFVDLCADQRRHCRWVNMVDFRNALNSWEIDRKNAYTALRVLELKNYLLAMTRGEGDEITDIVIAPPIYRCHACRLIVSSRQVWEDHLPICLRQQAKMRKLGLHA
jgi:hypothetical protein